MISYTTAIVLITACLAHAPKKCTQSGNFQFDIKSPSDFKILSARKLKTLFQKYKLELTTGVHACIGQASCVNTREFLKDTTTADSHENVAWKSEFIFFSVSIVIIPTRLLCQMQANSSINHIQGHEENEICHCLFTSFTKREIRHFFRVVVQLTARKCTKKRDAHVKLLFWLVNLLLI